jgi:heme exporter protein D
MNLGPHAAFIVSAYAVAVAIIAAIVVWILIDHRRQIRILAELEAQGVTRRSDRKSEGD